MADPEAHSISVCVLTYRRPVMLGRCLAGLQVQESRGFRYSIVVVDNDVERSGREAVLAAQGTCSLPLTYEVEPIKNISLARNRAIQSGTGDLLSFIDDDECPEPHWLANLFAAYVRYGVDGVLGPVLPTYIGSPPKWLVRSGLCVRDRFPTGTILRQRKYMRTGNVLFGRHIVRGMAQPFDPAFGRTGGEDGDFFARMFRMGRTFIWCNEARVYEEVPAERQKRSYYVRRALVRGANRARREPLLSKMTAKSVGVVLIFGAVLPILVATSHHLFMRYLVRGCDHVGKLLAYCGVFLARDRKD